MTDPEHDHFIRHIRDLERSRGRWRLAAILLALLLVVPLLGLVGVGIWVGPSWQLERHRLQEERDRAMQAQVEAQAQQQRAERALQQAEQKAEAARQQADKDKD
jgi:hypothetical protein